MTIISALFFSIPFFVLSFFYPNLVLNFFSPDIEVINLGAVYLKIIALSFPLFAISLVTSFMLRSIKKSPHTFDYYNHRIIFKYISQLPSYFGKLGFPTLGVKGAAIATLIARLIGCISSVLIVYLRKMPGRIYFRHFREITPLNSLKVIFTMLFLQWQMNLHGL